MTQLEGVLDMLADGRWKTTAEILRAVPCIVHSRVAEARARGFTIEHRTTGRGAAGSEYRLIGGALPPAAGDGASVSWEPAAAGSAPPDALSPDRGVELLGEPLPGQLPLLPAR